MRELPIFIGIACIILGMMTSCGADVLGESEMNAALSAKYGSNYHVLTDKDVNWSEDYLSMIADERSKDKNYPYVVVADLDGDGIADLAWTCYIWPNSELSHKL